MTKETAYKISFLVDEREKLQTELNRFLYEKQKIDRAALLTHEGGIFELPQSVFPVDPIMTAYEDYLEKRIAFFDAEIAAL